MAKKWMQVHVVTTEDAMFGNGPTDGYDVDDSRKTFVNMVEAKLAAQLPEYESDVIEVSWPKRAIVSDDNEDAEATAETIVNEVYGSFEWLVESE